MIYKIYQLNNTSSNDLRFAPFVAKERVKPENYKMVYEGNVESLPFAVTRIHENSKPEDILDYIFMIFNTAHPKDFKGKSLSVSDVVCLQNGTLQHYYYVDSVGYKLLDRFAGKVVTDIDWDTDGELVKELPKTVVFDPDVDNNEIADILSDMYGFCVYSFSVDGEQAAGDEANEE